MPIPGHLLAGDADDAEESGDEHEPDREPDALVCQWVMIYRITNGVRTQVKAMWPSVPEAAPVRSLRLGEIMAARELGALGGI